MRKFCWIALFLAPVAPAAAAGDWVVLEGGDALSGRVVRIADGVLVFRTALHGQMMAPVDTLEGLSTERNLAITLQDDTTLYGRFVREDGVIFVEPLDGSPRRPVALGEVWEALPIPAGAPRAEPEIRGSIEVGVRGRASTEDTLEPYARIGLSGEGARTAFDATLMAERADAGDFPRLAQGAIEVRGLSGERATVPFGALDVERDQVRALDLRAQLTLGFLHELSASGEHRVQAVGGVGAAYDEWSLRYLRSVSRRWHGRGASGGEVNLPLGLRFSRALFGDGEFAGDIMVYPSLTRLGELRARSAAALAYPIGQRLQLRLNLQLDYESAPEFRGLDHWSTSVGAGMRLDF